MKKIATVLLAAILGFCGCQKSTTTASNQPDSTSTTQTTSTDSSTADSTDNETRPASDTEDVPPEAAQPARTTSGEVVDITFDDIKLPIQEDIVFRPFMLTDRAKELDGQRVRISGFMLADAKTRGIEQFVLLKNTECKFGPGGQADHLVNVIMNEGQSTIFRNDAVAVEGVIKVNPFNGIDGNTWSIYDLTCDRVEKHRSRR